MTRSPANAHLYRAWVRLGLDQPGRAETELRAALALDPEEPRCHALLGWSLALRGRRAEAVREAATAVRLAPDRADVHRIRGQVLALVERPDDAVAALQDSLRLDPDEPLTHGAMAGVQLLRGRPARALQAAEAGLALDPENENCAHFRLEALLALGRRPEAHAHASAMIARDPEHAFAHQELGRLLIDEAPGAAAEHLRTALRLDPDGRAARVLLIWALMGGLPGHRRLRRFAWAARLYQPLVWLNPRHRPLFPRGSGSHLLADALPILAVPVVLVAVVAAVIVPSTAGTPLPSGGPSAATREADPLTVLSWFDGPRSGATTLARGQTVPIVPGTRYAVADGEGGFRILRVYFVFGDRVLLGLEPEQYADRPTGSSSATAGAAPDGVRCLQVGSASLAGWEPTTVGSALVPAFDPVLAFNPVGSVDDASADDRVSLAARLRRGDDVPCTAP